MDHVRSICIYVLLTVTYSFYLLLASCDVQTENKDVEGIGTFFIFYESSTNILNRIFILFQECHYHSFSKLILTKKNTQRISKVIKQKYAVLKIKLLSFQLESLASE